MAGFAAGFIAGGLLGPVRRDRVAKVVSGWRAGTAVPVTARGAAAPIRAALKAASGLADADLRVIPVNRGRVELHGWVGNRREVARTLRLAREAAPEAEVVGRLRVRGEDEGIPPTDDQASAVRHE